MITALDGQDVAFIGPGLHPNEPACLLDWVQGLEEEGLSAAAIRRQAGRMFTHRWHVYWSRAFGKRGYGLETRAAMCGRVVDILLVRPRPDQI
jgi:hypothetical protein